LNKQFKRLCCKGKAYALAQIFSISSALIFIFSRQLFSLLAKDCTVSNHLVPQKKLNLAGKMPPILSNLAGKMPPILSKQLLFTNDFCLYVAFFQHFSQLNLKLFSASPFLQSVAENHIAKIRLQ
jgi:hypothetical protein